MLGCRFELFEDTQLGLSGDWRTILQRLSLLLLLQLRLPMLFGLLVLLFALNGRL